MAYDATKLREEDELLEPPSITVRRQYSWWQKELCIDQIIDRVKGRTVTYEGRILSEWEWAPLKRRWADLYDAVDEDSGEVLRDDEGEPLVTDDDVLELIEDTCEAMGIPPSVIRRLPGRKMWEAMNDFLASQVRAATPGQKAKPTTKEVEELLRR